MRDSQPTFPINGMTISRRHLMLAGAALAVSATVPGIPGLTHFDGAAFAQDRVPVKDLLKEGALPDVWMGKEDAPVKIIEYASMTCSHCANFHKGTFKELKSKYIDTGKVRMTVREFPFDPLATAGFMLARCAGDDKRYALIDLLFDRQSDWIKRDALPELSKLTKQAGLSDKQFEACLKDRQLYEKVSQVRDSAAKAFNVKSTPTFFINGVRLEGDQPLAKFEEIMKPMLK